MLGKQVVVLGGGMASPSSSTSTLVSSLLLAPRPIAVGLIMIAIYIAASEVITVDVTNLGLACNIGSAKWYCRVSRRVNL
ncbi:hypothetical protein BDR07DRAFT_1414763 [Suillus spraguei]|nr:hypothetical protein BDR07DRAFT_1414763 [Suillus spraguei]